ncbi:hypothetical protein KUL118_04750 [Tenacibaculum sp. KUL118]|nr:hypothetical protein KUL118_04750 [Tenacibaculum sp. KUL118]
MYRADKKLMVAKRTGENAKPKYKSEYTQNKKTAVFIEYRAQRHRNQKRSGVKANKVFIWS